MKLTDLSVIRSLLGEEQTSFKKKYGQNFLINQLVVDRIADSCGESFDAQKLGVLEIGPGIGTLSAELCRRYKKVVCVEIDETLLPILDKTLGEFENVKVIHSDILKIDLQKLIQMEFADCSEWVVCANLPYYITTPILMFLLESGISFGAITVMVQKEVADRLTAPAGSDAYGSISASIAYYGEAQRLFTVRSGNFVPAPKVDSAVVRIHLWKEKPICPIQEDLFFLVIKAAFGQRRKTLTNALSAAFPTVEKEKWIQLLSDCGISPTARGETLSVLQFAAISDRLAEALSSDQNK
jgi:16S rRNA (adenine1518-N6/adenine1519-N6)-dimethyltransferase